MPRKPPTITTTLPTEFVPLITAALAKQQTELQQRLDREVAKKDAVEVARKAGEMVAISSLPVADTALDAWRRQLTKLSRAIATLRSAANG